MKRVLFILQSYPSERSANVDCDEKIINELKKNRNIEIYCLAYRYNFQPLESKYDGFKVFRFRKGFPFDLYSWARHHENNPIGKFLLGFHRFILLAKELLLLPFYPYIEPIGMQQCAREAIKLHDRLNFDLVFADHNGIDTLYAGKMVKERDPKVKFIAMMWDPMFGKNKPKYVSKRFHEKRCLRVQENLLNNADAIIMLDSVKSVYADKATSLNYFDKIKFYSIPGVVKTENPSNIVPERISNVFSDTRYNVVYTGLITEDRNPSCFIKLLDDSKFGEKFNIVFFGSKESSDIVKGIKTNRVTIQTHDYVDKRTLVLVYNLADAFLNLGGAEANMIPSKIFNYLSYGKPIFSTRTIDHDPSSQCLQRYPLACCIDVRDASALNMGLLEDFIESQIDVTLSFETVQTMYKESTPTIYVELIQHLLGEESADGQWA